MAISGDRHYRKHSDVLILYIFTLMYDFQNIYTSELNTEICTILPLDISHLIEQMEQHNELFDRTVNIQLVFASLVLIPQCLSVSQEQINI